MRRLVLAIAALLALAACGPQADSKTVVEVFLSAREVGDVSSAMSVVSPNATLRAPNQVLYKGADQITKYLQTTLNDYSFELTQAPKLEAPEHVSWKDTLYSQANGRWIGDIVWEAVVSDDKISDLHGTVVRGASGIICPQCPEGTKI
jgi:hypothetical protein